MAQKFALRPLNAEAGVRTQDNQFKLVLITNLMHYFFIP
jgi:hypothetical protein